MKIINKNNVFKLFSKFIAEDFFIKNKIKCNNHENIIIIANKQFVTLELFENYIQFTIKVGLNFEIPNKLTFPTNISNCKLFILKAIRYLQCKELCEKIIKRLRLFKNFNLSQEILTQMETFHTI